MSELNHKCIVCGEMYHSCDNCQQIKSYTPWRALCDTWDHYQVYLLIRTFQEGLDTKENIQTQLRGLGITRSSYVDWPEGTKGLLNQIFEITKKNKRIVRVEDECIATESEEPINIAELGNMPE